MEAVEEYQQQLKVIENALKTSPPGPERDELLSLKENIKELLLLTTETANIINKGSSCQDDEDNTTSDKTKNDGDCQDDEWSAFMSEMVMEGAIEAGTDNKLDAEEEVNKKIKELEGQKCQAPYKQKWGQMSYHNAMICSVLEGSDIDNLQVKVLFLNPTHKEMLPCPYYFDVEKECHYDEDSCRYSHGQLVDYSDVKVYIEPKFENLTIGSNVIAKQEDELWYKGKITRISKGKCMVKFESKSSKQKDIFEEISLEHVLPMEQDEAGDGSDSDDCQIIDDDEVNEMEARERKRKHQELINKSLLVTPESKPLGEWEKYTKGFGSKLMQKMGYIVGTGLGKDGSGIIKPVSAVILPQGKSLDFCMQLKEQTQNPNLFHADSKVTQGHKKKKVNTKAKKKEIRWLKFDAMSLENFIDHSIQQRGQDRLKRSQETQMIQEKLKNETDKNANLCLFKLDESLKKIKMQSQNLDLQIVSMEQRLTNVPKSMHNKQRWTKTVIERAEMTRRIIKNELDRRRNNKEMSVF